MVKTTSTYKLALLALFIAIRVMAGMFRIPLTESLMISFSFVFIMIETLIFDYPLVVLSATIGDILNALVFPSGPFYWGYTAFAVLQTSLYWIGLHHRPITVARLAVVKTINNLFCNVIINSLLVWHLYQVAYPAAVLSRLPKNLILLPIEILLAYLVIRLVKPLLISKGLVESQYLPMTIFKPKKEN